VELAFLNVLASGERALDGLHEEGLDQWVSNHLLAAAGSRVETLLALRADMVDIEVIQDPRHLEALWKERSDEHSLFHVRRPCRSWHAGCA
jgi:hypothetical protein